MSHGLGTNGATTQCMHTHTNTYLDTHTHTETHIYAQKQNTYPDTHIYTNIHKHTHAYTIKGMIEERKTDKVCKAGINDEIKSQS